MEKYNDLIEKIKNHTLGNKQEASTLYFAFCDCLKGKYGSVDRDYDDNPTRRGKDWIDIHHIREYELDDIARRTNIARDLEKRKLKKNYEDHVTIVLKSNDWNNEKMEEIRKRYLDKPVEFWRMDYSLNELKPYNVKEQLVYANKIEHFLLHYLIVSMQDLNFAGGPNYLWDDSIALDVYGFDKEFMNNLKSVKEKFYSVISSEDITILYKKLIDWKNWDILQCSTYWINNKNIIQHLNEKQISYVEDKDKFFKILDILGFALNKDIYNKIISLPYKVKFIICPGGIEAKEINGHIYSIDGKTALKFRIHSSLKSFTVPSNIEKIANGAFFPGFHLEKIIIPISVKEIENKAFTGYPYNLKGNGCVCPRLKTIYYKGTKTMWDANFSNVETTDGVRIVCKRNKYSI